MKTRLLLPLTLAITLAAWTAVTWPLPRMVLTAIPASGLNHPNQPPRYMVPGDHLQLLYRFWLFGDILKGNSSYGTNVYEFNRGNDGERRHPGAYYVPFSLVYFAGAALGGMPFGWNLTGVVYLWLTYLCTVWLLRFYTRGTGAALVFGALAILFPYRYVALLGGSPTGYAMLWPPLIALGLEGALREKRLAGGILAGAGLFLTCISDLQLFLFATGMAAAWGAVVWGRTWHTYRESAGQALARALRTLWPVALALLVSYIHVRTMKAFVADSAHMASGRLLTEVAIFSPTPTQLFSLPHGHNAHGAFLGNAWMLLAGLSILFLVYRAIRKRTLRDVAVAAAWTAGMALVMVLSLGPNGPRNGALFSLARHLVPPLQMVRQPTRFLTLAPTLIPVMLGVLSAPLLRRLRPRGRAVLLGAFAVFMAAEYVRSTRVELCLLDPAQRAYAAVRSDIDATDETPVRALAIPLWPGDSHWSSLYIYYASLYRIRMLNGYGPVVAEEYRDQIFEHFRSLNAGVVRDEQLDDLLAMGIRHLLLHEDAFPEVVSPFPVNHTLNQFGLHPRLEVLAHADRVWAFRILEEPSPAAAGAILDCPIRFPTRRYHPGRHRLNASARLAEPSAVRNVAVRLSKDHPEAYVAYSSLAGIPDAVWLMRVRGKGALKIVIESNDDFEQRGVVTQDDDPRSEFAMHPRLDEDADDHPDEKVGWSSPAMGVNSEAWTWLAIPAGELPDYSIRHIWAQWRRGEVDVDHICYTTQQSPLEEIRLDPACFFRSGRTDADSGAVDFQPDRDIRGRVLYGPRLPVATGPRRILLHFESDAPPKTRLGSWQVKQPEFTPLHSVDVVAGESPAVVDLDLEESLPVVFSFHYAATHPIRITRVTLESRAAPSDSPGETLR